MDGTEARDAETARRARSKLARARHKMLERLMRMRGKTGLSRSRVGAQISAGPLEQMPNGHDRLLFSYTSEQDSRLRRLAMRTVERVTGQPKLKRMYLRNQSHPVPGESFWQAAIRMLGLRLHYDRDALAAAPSTGPLVLVANHPFGVVDGLVIGYLAEQLRPDFKILANSVLYRAPEMRDYILPIDFDPTPGAQQLNLRSRAEAANWLGDGHCLVVFPGGTVSTAPKPFARRAVDPDWKPYTARLVRRAKATVLPVFFAGQNSRLFQIASHVSYSLRLSLLFHEVRNKIGADLAIAIGAPIPPAAIAQMRDNRELTAHLRDSTYCLQRALPWTPRDRLQRRIA